MKKLKSFTIALAMILSLVSCGGQSTYTGNGFDNTSDPDSYRLANIPEKDSNTSDMPTFYENQFYELSDHDRDAFTNTYNGQMVRIVFVNFSQKIDLGSYLDDDASIKVYTNEYYEDFPWDDGGWVVEGIVSSNEPGLVIINDADILIDTGGHWWEDGAYSEGYYNYDDNGNLIIDLSLTVVQELLQEYSGESVRITNVTGYSIVDQSTYTIEVHGTGGQQLNVKLLDQTQLATAKSYRGFDVTGKVEYNGSTYMITRGIIDKSNIGQSSAFNAISASKLSDDYYGQDVVVSNITCTAVHYVDNYVEDLFSWLCVSFANEEDIYNIGEGDYITVSGLLTKESLGVWEIVDATLVSVDGGLNVNAGRPAGPLYGASKPNAEDSAVFQNSVLIKADDLFINEVGSANYDYNGHSVRLEGAEVDYVIYNEDGTLSSDMVLYLKVENSLGIRVEVNNAKEKISIGDYVNVYGICNIEPNMYHEHSDKNEWDNVNLIDGGVYYK